GGVRRRAKRGFGEEVVPAGGGARPAAGAGERDGAPSLRRARRRRRRRRGRARAARREEPAHPRQGSPLRGKAEKIAAGVRPDKGSITVGPRPLADVHYRYPLLSSLQLPAPQSWLTLRVRLGSAIWAHKGANVTVR